jgi:hypothetical protein
MKLAFRHIHVFYSPQNIFTMKYLFTKNGSKTKMTSSRRTSRDPVLLMPGPGTGPRPGEPLVAGITDARTRYRAAARRLRNTALHHRLKYHYRILHHILRYLSDSCLLFYLSLFPLIIYLLLVFMLFFLYGILI